MQLKIY